MAENDSPKKELKERIKKLEKHVYPDRRDILKGAGGAAVGLAAGVAATGNAAAGSQSAGTWGTQSKPQDGYFEDLYDLNGNNVLSAPGDGSVKVDDLASKHEPLIDVTHPDYGAVGDGTTDDTQAIKDAITEAKSTGNPVYFPAGDYLFTSALSPGSNVTFIGAEPKQSVLVFEGTDTYAIDGQSNNWNYWHRIGLKAGNTNPTHGFGGAGTVFRNSKFDHVWVDGFPGDGFHFVDCNQTVLDNVTSRNNDRGYYVDTQGGDLTFRDCLGVSNGSYGAYVQRCQRHVTFRGGDYSSNGNAGIGTNDVEGLQIEDTYHESNTNRDIDMTDGPATACSVSPGTCRSGIGIHVGEYVDGFIRPTTRFSNGTTAIELGATNSPVARLVMVGEIRQTGTGSALTKTNVNSGYHYESTGGAVL